MSDFERMLSVLGALGDGYGRTMLIAPESDIDFPPPPFFPDRQYIAGLRKAIMKDAPRPKRKRPFKGSKAAKRASRKRRA